MDENEVLDLLEEVDDDPLEVERLSEAMADREARLATTREELAQARAELEAAKGEASRLIDRYRSAVLAANPDLPPDLLQGTTLDELEASRESGLGLVEEVRRGLTSAPKVPAGSPRREAQSAPASAGDRIRLGLSLRQD